MNEESSRSHAILKIKSSETSANTVHCYIVNMISYHQLTNTPSILLHQCPYTPTCLTLTTPPLNLGGVYNESIRDMLKTSCEPNPDKLEIKLGKEGSTICHLKHF